MRVTFAARAALACFLAAAPASADAPSPAPSPSPTPPAVGATLISNDPCTTLTAIVTRPTVTNSVCTVRPGHVLVETGYTNQAFAGGGNVVSVPQSNVRLGLPRGLELDVVPPSVALASASGQPASAQTDAGAGLKYVLGASPSFNYGVQAGVTVPSGSRGVSAEATQTTGALNAGFTVGPAFALAGTASFSSLALDGERYGAFVPSLVLSATVTGSTTAFVEAAWFTHALGPGTATRSQLMGGVSTDVGPFVQLDVSYAISPTTATNRYRAIGVGLSFYR